MVNVQLLQLVEKLLGTSKKLSNDEYSFYCPSCQHRKPKLQINLEHGSSKFGSYHCWICGESNNTKGKNLFTLFKKFNATLEQIHELSSLVSRKYNAPIIERNILDNKPVVLPQEYVPLWLDSNNLIRRHALTYLSKRGITVNDILRYGIGYCDEGKYKNRIIIPSFDKNAHLNYFVARDIFDTSIKYLNPPADKSNIIVFELFINFQLDVTIVEGIFDAIKVKHNAIPILGKSVPSALIKQLLLNHTTVNIYFDPDAIKTLLKIAQQLINNGLNVYLVEPDKQRDPGDLTTYENKIRIENRRKATMADFIKAGIKI